MSKVYFFRYLDFNWRTRMDPVALEAFAQTLFQAITLAVLIFGWLGLLIPVFPGLVVMWIATLVYAIIHAGLGNMNWVGWLLFTLITLLMIGGNVADNFIIAKHMRDKDIPWSSILWSFAAGIIVSLFFTPIMGMVASPLALFLAEWRRLKIRDTALANTKAWMTGWGWSVAARMGIGMLMILFWGMWAWSIKL